MATITYDAKSRELADKEQNFQSLVRLVILCMIAFSALAVFVIYKTSLGGGVPWTELFFRQKEQNEAFNIDGVKLGMTPEKVMKLRPNLSLAVPRTGGKLATYVSRTGAYAVWFMDKARGEKAYRIRYDQGFKNLSEMEILKYISSRYGNPAISNCDGGAIAGAEICQYRWWPMGGVSLDLIIRTSRAAAGGVNTDVTMTAADTNLEGKKARRASIVRTPFRHKTRLKGAQATVSALPL